MYKTSSTSSITWSRSISFVGTTASESRPATLTVSSRQEQEKLRRPYNICTHAAVTCQCQRPCYDGLRGRRRRRVVKNTHDHIDVTIPERVYDHADHGADDQSVPMTHRIVTWTFAFSHIARRHRSKYNFPAAGECWRLLTLRPHDPALGCHQLKKLPVSTCTMIGSDSMIIACSRRG